MTLLGWRFSRLPQCWFASLRSISGLMASCVPIRTFENHHPVPLHFTLTTHLLPTGDQYFKSEYNQ